jgi:hypothetical protein
MQFRRRCKVCLQAVDIIVDRKPNVKAEKRVYREIIWVYAIELSELFALEWSGAACISLAGSCSDVGGRSM